MNAPGGYCPDWYLAIRAAKYGNEKVSEALGIPWSPLLQDWCLIAEAAEHEAEAELIKAERAKAKR